MKKKLLCCFSILIVHQALAQNPVLITSTLGGGPDSGGVVLRLNSDGTGVSILHSFNNPTCVLSNDNALIDVGNGRLYGMITGDGYYKFGNIFRYDTISGTFTNVFSANDSIGTLPCGRLCFASDGKLYGMSSYGGLFSQGSIFSINPANDNYAVLSELSGTTGANPVGNSLIEASDHKIYGLTYNGGAHSFGALFAYNPLLQTYTDLHDFDSTEGSFPVGALVQHSNGRLFGLTFSGGADDKGVIFRYEISTHIYTKLHDFNPSDGFVALGSLVEWNGKLFGLTNKGGANNHGVLFSLDPSNSTYTILKSFGGTDGKDPCGSLILASNGLLYGTTLYGGLYNQGVVFSFDPVGNSFQKILDFNDVNGKTPNGNLTESATGLIYGMTTGGGSLHGGNIFSCDLSGSGFSSHYELASSIANEVGPQGKLIQAPDGKLYGVTAIGGVFNAGTLFNIDPVTNEYNCLHDFTGRDGARPWGSLFLASDSRLYGTASYGGTLQVGTAFSYDPSSEVFSKLIDFNYTCAYQPNGALAEGPGGKLYGTSYEGGNFYGNIFSINTGNNTCADEHDFDFNYGDSPLGGLVLHSNGIFYGVTTDGGANFMGDLYSYNPVSHSFVHHYDLPMWDVEFSVGALAEAPNGILFGMSSEGNGYGNIFSYNVTSGQFLIKYNFSSSDGMTPDGTLTLADDGNFYGTTYEGGNYNLGVIFKYNPVSNTLTDILHFDGSNGANTYSDVTELNNTVGINQQQSDLPVIHVYPNPGNNFLCINFSASAQTIYKMVISDPAGKIIMQKDFSCSAGKNIFTIDTSQLADGIYNLSLSNDYLVQVARFVISN